MVEADHDHVPATAAGEAGRVGHAAVGVPLVRVARDVPGAQFDRRAQGRMVHEVAADLGHVPHHRDPQRPQVGGRTEAGAQQDRRRMDGAGTDQDFARPDLHPAATGQVGAHAGCAPVGDEHAVHQGIADDLEVGPAARGFEKGLVDRNAAAVPAVDRVARDPFPGRRVEIGVPLVAGGQGGIAQAAIDRAPQRLGCAVDRDGASRAALRRIVLEGGDHRHHVGGRPALAAGFRPFVERVGDAADGDLGVDRGRPAQRLAAPVEARCLGAGAARHQQRPLPLGLVRRVVHERDDVGAPHGGGRRCRAPVPPGFQQQHAATRISRKEGGGGRAGRSAANHDHVVHLRPASNFGGPGWPAVRTGPAIWLRHKGPARRQTRRAQTGRDQAGRTFQNVAKPLRTPVTVLR